MKKNTGKLVRRLKKASNRKVIPISELRAARDVNSILDQAGEAARQVLEDGLDPVFAANVELQFRVSLMVESLLGFPETSRHLAWLERNEEAYTPSQPPLSPVTGTFFQNLGWFDVGFGIERETLGDMLLGIARSQKYPRLLQDHLADLADGHTGIYRQTGLADDYIFLRELVTDKDVRVLSMNPYEGFTDALWLVRLVPDRMFVADRHITITTPYILTAGVDQWLAYLDRQQITDEHAYRRLMKPGPNREFWLEFIHQAYAGTNNAGASINLAGLPDFAASRPHFSDLYPDRLPETSLSVNWRAAAPHTDAPAARAAGHAGRRSGAADAFNALLTQSLEEHPEIQTEEELQFLVSALSDKLNAAPLDDFSGLSPDQVYQLFHEPVANIRAMRCHRNLEPFPENRMFAMVWELLGLLSSATVKATGKGNLPLKVCRALKDVAGSSQVLTEQLAGRRFNSEEDLIEVHCARLLAELAGLVERTKTRFALTASGGELFEQRARGEIAVRLLETHARQLNWAYFDGYAAFPTIQMAAFFSLYLLQTFGAEQRPADEYSERFLRALPMTLDDADEEGYFGPERQVAHAYRYRTMERFAYQHGLASLDYEATDGSFRRALLVRKTAYLDALLAFPG
jgi:hypothetical protein